jgi:uncharacterized protein (DUF1697 family)
MSHYVAFLRGINVGGRVVVKSTLQKAFSDIGFQNVSTYKQSGNVIFETDIANPEEVKAKIENKLYSALGYRIAVFIRTIPQLTQILHLDPFKNQSEEGASFLVTFLPSVQAELPFQLPLIIPKSTAQILSVIGSEFFSVTHGGGEGALPNPYLESKLKVKATTRNMNIIRAIVEKYRENA